jgi:hypothetical protein
MRTHTKGHQLSLALLCKTQQQGDHLQVGRILARNRISWYLDLGLGFRAEEKKKNVCV